MDRLERILRDDPAIAPSAGFASSVMRAVREEAAAPAAIGFPWRRALFGLGLCLASLAAAILVAMGSGADSAGALLAAASPGTVPAAVLLTMLLLCAPVIRLAARRA